jgi:hypothetical protein
MTTIPLFELELTDLLKGRGFSRIAIEANTLVVVCNDGWIRSQISVGDWGRTIETFRKAAKILIPDKETMQALVSFISKKWMDVLVLIRLQDEQRRRQRKRRNSGGGYDTQNVTDTDTDTEERRKKMGVRTEVNPVEYVINIVKRDVKGEDHNIRIIVYVGLSANTFNPLCLAIRAPTSEGKTHMVVKSMSYLPEKDIIYIGTMSPKTLVRQYGTLVDQNNQPIAEEVRELKKEIALAERAAKKDPEKIKQALELRDELDMMLSTAKYLINLHGKILVFLDAPHPGVWSIIKPILSHDKWELEHPYVDTDIKTKNVVTRGWPVCIFCSARDETKWDIWPEIQSRFLMISPNMSEEKYKQANILTVQKGGMPEYVQQQVIVSDDEIMRAQRCMADLSQDIQELCVVPDHGDARVPWTTLKPKNPVCIPYGEYLGPSLPHSKGVEMRDTKHLTSLLHVIAIAKSPFRLDTSGGKPVPGLASEIKGSMDVIARPEDLVEALRLVKDVMMSEYAGIPAQKKWFFENIFYPCYNAKKDADEQDGKTEAIKAVTTSDLADYYKRATGKGIDTNNLQKVFLDELVNNNLVGKTDSKVDKRRKIYHPLIDEKIQIFKNESPYLNILDVPTLTLSRDYNEVQKDWLVFQILTLIKYRINLDQAEGPFADFLNGLDEFKLLEINGLYNGQSDLKRLTIRDFIAKYEGPRSISILDIFEPHFKNFHSKIFGKMKEIPCHRFAGYTIFKYGYLSLNILIFELGVVEGTL